MKETHYKLKHRVTALFAAAVMLCSMLPGAAFAEEPTPQPTEETVQMEQQTEPSETDNGQTDESSPDPGEDVTEATPETAEEQPAEEEISAAVVARNCTPTSPTHPLVPISAARVCRLPPVKPKSAFASGPKASWKKPATAI